MKKIFLFLIVTACFSAPRAQAEKLPLYRESPQELSQLEKAEMAGSAKMKGETSKVLVGDPTKSGMYAILLRLPPHTKVAAHSHPDNRIATVISGTWRFGYGDQFDESNLKELPPGSVYTEPAGQNHFAMTGNEPVTVEIVGNGPSGTTFVEKKVP